MKNLVFALVMGMVGAAFLGVVPGSALAMLKVDHATIRLDRPLPIEKWQWQEGWPEVRQFFPRYFQPAATIHLFVRNDGNSPLDITQIGYNGQPIEEVTTTAEFAGPVIWYRANPELLPPGQIGMIYVRLRNIPIKPVEVSVTTKDGQTVTTRLSENDHEQMRLGYVGFNREIDKIYIYVERFTEEPLSIYRIYLDGKDVTAASKVVNGSFAAGRPALIEVSLDGALAYGSFHSIKVTSHQGPAVMHQVRARDNRFLIGIVHGMTPLKEYWAKFFNALYSIHGDFPETPGWWDEDSELARLGFVHFQQARTEASVKAGATVPPGRIIYTNIDEPDARDFGIPGMPLMKRCGISIMRDIEPVMRMQRRLDPHHFTATIINRTFTPLNWFHYGEVPDIPITNPYVPTQWHGYDLFTGRRRGRPLNYKFLEGDAH